MKKLLSILALTISFLTAFAPRLAIAGMQDGPEMADTMRSNGKIYVVVGVILIVLAGLFIYLFSIERKVKKLEQKLEDNR
jgi:hypothetical protein